MTVHLPLVPCQPFSARLTIAACVGRHRDAQRPGHELSMTACRSCAVGAERAGTVLPDARPASLYVELGPACNGRVRAQCACGSVRLIPVGQWRHERPRGCRDCVGYKRTARNNWGPQVPRTGLAPSRISRVIEDEAGRKKAS